MAVLEEARPRRPAVPGNGPGVCPGLLPHAACLSCHIEVADRVWLCRSIG